MKKNLTLENSFLLVIFCLPLYLIRVIFTDVPSNLLELLALFITILALKKEGFFVIIEKIKRLPEIFIFSAIILLIGVLLSIFSNDAKIVGFGILKSWFIVPILFSFALYTQLKDVVAIEKIFLSIYFSTVTVSLISLGYKFIGIVTFDNRLTSFYLSPNHLSMYLVPGIIFGTYFLAKSLSEKISSKKTMLHLILHVTMLSSLYFTYSYASWIALCLSLLVCLFFAKINRRYLFAGTLSIIILFVMFFFFQKNTEKFSSLENLSSRSSLASRLTIWQVSTLLIKENPIVGVGPGNFQSAYLSKQFFFKPYLEWAVPQPHNIFLAFWLQSGFLGMAGFLLLLFFIFRNLLFLSKNKKDIAIAIHLLGFFIYFILHGLVDTTYWKNDLSFLFWIAAFATIALCQKTSNEKS